MPDMISAIRKKQNGEPLGKGEIEDFVKGVVSGEVPDYQTAALLMAIYFKGLNSEEIFSLTEAMRDSGDIVDLSGIPGIKADKHSTGGVGDKTTFITVPLAAACGVSVAKMSGRGLGFTGGTVDKMEAIPGMRTALAKDEFFKLVKDGGFSVMGQSGNLAPADKKIYALRDVTATVDVLGLIASSVMSKKLASGSDALVLDIKCGAGAFMRTEGEARGLAGIMVDIGANAGKKVIAAITDMDQPLGMAVGNSLEVIEAIEVLKGSGAEDIRELALGLAAFMIFAAEKSKSVDEGYKMAQKVLANGEGLKKLKDFIAGQGGDPRVTEDYGLFPQASLREVLLAEEEGFISGIDARAIGMASQKTGAGRGKKDDVIDLSAGALLRKKVGDRVAWGEELVCLLGNDREKLQRAAATAKGAFRISSRKPRKREMIIEVVSNIKGMK